MSYTAYEESTGKARLGVEALCKHLTLAGAFSPATQPTLTEVEDWLTEGWRAINAVLMDYGYDVPSTPSSMDADVRGVLQRYNIWYACAQAEYSQPSAGFSEGSGSRGNMFTEMFWGSRTYASGRDAGSHPGIAKTVQSAAFKRLGHTKAEELSGALTAGGVSISGKLTISADTDYPQYAFRRGQFDNPGSLGVQAGRADL